MQLPLNTKKLPRLALWTGGYEICHTNFTSTNSGAKENKVRK
jgi:hypothetical protein